MRKSLLSRKAFLTDTAILCYLAVGKLVMHFLTNGQYGYFRDELYYIICGERLDWGYVDHAPLIALVARVSHALLGQSLLGTRFFPAVAGALLVLLAGLIARELGGKRFAQVLAALCVIIMPAYLYTHTMLSMNAFEPLLWMLAAYVVILILKRQDARLWLLFGLVAGIGLMNKHSMLFFGLGLVVGLVFAGQRAHFRSGWFWLGGAIAFAIFLPNILWQIRNGWPTLEFWSHKEYWGSPEDFLVQQVFFTHPIGFLIALIGLWYYLGSRDGKPYRALGWIYVVMLVLFLVKGNAYYLSPIYPMLFAAGAVVMEGWIQRRGLRWLKPAVLSLTVAGGIVLAPMALPVLPVDQLITYLRCTGLKEVFRLGREDVGELPQHYADMFGWEEMVYRVALVYNSLPPEDRAKAVIFASNYGQASAINIFGKEYGLPSAVSGNMTYYLWGPGYLPGEVTIIIGFNPGSGWFAQVQHAGIIPGKYALERYVPIYVCRGPGMSLQWTWPQLKAY
jgi:4-amino-4-deoxy-L-arabinose transferase-like glycosyltransferase